MTLIKWNPSIFSQAEGFFDDFFKSYFPMTREDFIAKGTSVPAINVKENDEEFLLEMAAPGLNKGDFTVSVEQGVLLISVDKKLEKESTEDGYMRKEFNYSHFQRSFSLPEAVDEGKIKASYRDGILYLVLPKKPEAKPKPAKSIKIS